MSFNRLTYDSCAYSKTVQQSTNPLEYNLYKGKYESCRHCPITNDTNNLEFGIRSDVESDLKNQTRIGTRCDALKFPANSLSGAAYTTPLACQSIYDITPSNIVKPITSGLRPLSDYGQNMCMK